MARGTEAGVVRGYVFPTLRLLVWAVIAVALVYLAFFRPDARADEGGPASPSAVLDSPEASVTRGDVVNTVSVTGTIEADAATVVKSTAAGQVGRVRVAVGDVVEQGTPLFTVVVPVEETATTSGTTSGAPDAAATAPAVPRTRTVTVTATGPGTLTTLDVLPQQDVTVGQEVARVSPGTLTAAGSLTQEQQFRLLSPPTSAEVTVPGGPGTFSCTDLTTGTPAAGSGDDGADQQGFVDPFSAPTDTLTGARVSCRVPADVRVFAGLSATLDITAGRATGVLLAPVTAVRGRVDNGAVWVLGDDGAQTETPVTLGLTDGVNVEITGGVEEGARILQFAPGDDTVQDPYAPGGIYG
ncbi:biotin/lipoyl-containing protein [Kineococcus gynurae]|uniref:Biotin/lipoyl-containing protein n=1 Tax=Kineococcus gynurae TaxID=452979 RepID=A0ABV5LNL5_9ACTN